MNDDDLESFRFLFQKILVPIVVIVGCFGNGISCVVLTRRRMRCSTNIYLTALAIADILFLFFIFVLSFQHYNSMHSPKYELYWRLYGFSVWVCDASSYTSIYLTVSFTIERYIAVCHPIRGQVLCTESRAKKVIAVVFIFCFISTITTSFEHQIGYETRYYNRTSNELCTNQTNNINNKSISNIINDVVINDGLNQVNHTNDEIKIKFDRRRKREIFKEFHLNQIINSKNYNKLALKTKRSSNHTNNEKIIKIPLLNDKKINEILDEECEEKQYIVSKPSSLGDNETYGMFINIFSSIVFTFTPLILLATFNCYLIAAVHRSSRLRHKMTYTSTRPVDSSIQQENKITIILIAVCVLFLVCQSPTAIFLIIKSIVEIKQTNEALAIGNFFNFLITLNAACNFILYCALSDKYRQTVRMLFCSKKRKYSQNSFRSSQISRFPSSRYSSVRFDNSQNINNKESKFMKTRHKSMPAMIKIEKKIEKPTKVRSKSYCGHIFVGLDVPVVKNENISNGNRPRSQSLTLGPKTKHSPHCKDFPHKF